MEKKQSLTPEQIKKLKEDKQKAIDNNTLIKK